MPFWNCDTKGSRIREVSVWKNIKVKGLSSEAVHFWPHNLLWFNISILCACKMVLYCVFLGIILSIWCSYVSPSQERLNKTVLKQLLSLDLNQSSSTIKTWNKSCLNCIFIMKLVLDVANAILKFLDGNRVSCSFCRHNFR